MADDFSALENMIYSGRGITVGLTPKGNAFIGYSLTGRSPPSQARELLAGKESGTVRTSVITEEDRLRKMFNINDDEQLAKLKADLEGGSPALLLYPALTYVHQNIVASNGAQTKLLYSTVCHKRDGAPQGIMLDAVHQPVFEYDQKDDQWIDITTYEPDAPNSTPRISACLAGRYAALHIVRKGDKGQKEAEIIPFEPSNGGGKLITTYAGGNEKPLAPFKGAPLDVGISSETPQDIAESIYAAIHGGQKEGDNYRVAAAVLMRDSKVGGVTIAIINRIDRGE